MKKSYSLPAAAVAAFAFAAVTLADPTPAAAQEIQLTGPLAGAPAVRKLRLYRQGRAELALGPGFTLLDEYQRTIFVAGRLQYNIFDWLGIGVFGGFGAASLDTDLTEKIETQSPRNSRVSTNLPSPDQAARGNPGFNKQTGKLKWMAAPQLAFSPFRGKLALFQKIFVDTDLYVHGGVAFIGVEERGDCAAPAKSCTTAASFAPATRTAIAPTFGLGLTLYASGFISINVEYRAFPFAYNRGGFDSRGAPPDGNFPDNKITDEDRTFKFNQMVFLGAGFHFPTTPKVSE
jgi:outer membrane beta-barrel protein